MVTRPAVPPYSSTTMAICTCLRWNSLSSSGTRLVSGTNVVGLMSGVIGRSSDSDPSTFSRSLTRIIRTARCPT